MSGLKQAARCRAIRARFRRRISSSLLPENIGPVMTSMRPTSLRPTSLRLTSLRPDAEEFIMRTPLRFQKIWGPQRAHLLGGVKIRGPQRAPLLDGVKNRGATSGCPLETSYAQPRRGFPGHFLPALPHQTGFLHPPALLLLSSSMLLALSLGWSAILAGICLWSPSFSG